MADVVMEREGEAAGGRVAAAHLVCLCCGRRLGKLQPSFAHMYRLDWAKKVSLAAICLVAGSISFGIRIN